MIDTEGVVVALSGLRLVLFLLGRQHLPQKPIILIGVRHAKLFHPVRRQTGIRRLPWPAVRALGRDRDVPT